MDKTRKNTLKIVLAQGVKVPLHLDVLRFTATVLKIPAPDVHSIYRDENDHCFYIKFMDEAKFNEFTGRVEEQYRFVCSDGQTTLARLEVASRLFRYVRIFNLPPEIEEKDIAATLSQFGTIRQHVRERYPTDYGYAVFSGVRGVHMEIAKEIPPNVYIGHFKARLYYEGLKNKCFYCKMEGHIKINCPKAAKDSAIAGSYSSVVSGAIVNNTSDVTLPITMTTLTSQNNTPTPQIVSPPLPTRDDISPIRPAPPRDDDRMDNDEASSSGDEAVETTEETRSETDLADTSKGERQSRSVQKTASVLEKLDGRSRSRSKNEFKKVQGKGRGRGKR